MHENEDICKNNMEYIFLAQSKSNKYNYLQYSTDNYISRTIVSM